MPHNKNTDRVVRRMLAWIVLLGLSGLLAYFFYPQQNDYTPPDEDNYMAGYDSASEDGDQNQDDYPLDELDPYLDLELSAQEYAFQQEMAAKQRTQPMTPATSTSKDKPTQQNQLDGFIKHVRRFTNARNYWRAIEKSNLNPKLIKQLEPLHKRLSWASLRSVDILYTNYYSHGTFNPDNSKLLMVRGRTNNGSWTYYAYEKNGHLRFYDEKGEAPEQSMDRVPFQYSRISSPFNLHRRHPITGRIQPHEGVDLVQSYGHPVHATGNGVVTFAGNQHGYGRIVIIHHSNDYETRYAHLSSIQVKVGDRVKRGDIIGKLGNSGISTGAHTHYEVRINGVPHDPMKIKLPSYQPLPRSYMQTWRFRTAQYREEMHNLLTQKK